MYHLRNRTIFHIFPPVKQVYGSLLNRNSASSSNRRISSRLQHVNDISSRFPDIWLKDVQKEIDNLIVKVDRTVVVLDDDPTGTQTVHSVPVLSTWDVQTLKQQLLKDEPYKTFYILTNSRSLSCPVARMRNSEIVRNLAEALKSTSKNATIISRSDSTLRGHFPEELQTIQGIMETHLPDTSSSIHNFKYDGWVLVPFFEEGGRLTIDDIHYVKSEDGTLVPAGETQFAKDKAFGYHSSNLKEWIEEKTKGKVNSDSVISISLQDLRLQGPDFVANKLLAMPQGAICIVNAITQRDLDVFVCAALKAELEGRSYLYRTAASFVATRAGIPRRPLLTYSELQDDDGGKVAGGLTVVGSYVQKTSEQLQHVLKSCNVEEIEMVVVNIVSGRDLQKAAYISKMTAEVDSLLKDGKDVVLYTSRDVLQDDSTDGLETGAKVNDALCAVVRDLKHRPRYLVAKGGITSNDIAVRSLSVARATVKGQILPGVPVWTCGQGSKYPGMNYVVFPGNVGGPSALTDALQKLGVQEKNPKKPDFRGVSRTGVDIRQSKDRRESLVLKMLKEAKEGKYAIGAFNVYNIEGIKAVVNACEKVMIPSILQVHPASLEFSGTAILAACQAAAAESKVPIAVHLDHASGEESIRCALDFGVDSIMADGSGFEYEENMMWTARMAELAHAQGIPIEAELGKLAGEEDGLSISEKEAKMTDPKLVSEFIQKTGADLLAVTIGNVHGNYKLPPDLDFDRLQKISAQTTAFLVLHGTSGLPEVQVHRAIKLGVCKLNVNTELRQAYRDTLTKLFSSAKYNQQKEIDVLGVMSKTEKSMQEVVGTKLKIFKP